jgi:hypothetical protein
MRKLARLNIAIGGFLIVTSLVLTGIIFLILMNIIEIDVFADQTNTLLLTLVLLVVGVLDFVAGIILMLKR